MQTGNQAGEDEMMAEDAGFEDIEAGRGVVVAGETDARGRMSAAAITDRITDGAVFVLSAAGLGRYALSEQGLRLKVLASAVEIDEESINHDHDQSIMFQSHVFNIESNIFFVSSSVFQLPLSNVFNQPTIQPTNSPTNQSLNQSINQPINQSFNQSV